MQDYKSASYQFEVMNELSKQEKVCFYGPGFDGYNSNDTFNEVKAKVPFKIDCNIL